MKAGSWYLVARAQGNMRTYKIAKIQNIETLEEDFAYPEAFDLASHWRDELKRFERSLRQGEATLRISPRRSPGSIASGRMWRRRCFRCRLTLKAGVWRWCPSRASTMRRAFCWASPTTSK